MRKAATILTTLALIGAAPAASQEHESAVGDYSGNAMETASGLRISADGTFQYYLSVGALDLRAAGTWERQGDLIRFTSDPKPVPAEFVWKGFRTTPDAPFLAIVTGAQGKPFDYASLTVVCANGAHISEQAQLGIWSPSEDDECDQPEKVKLRLGMYDIESRPFDLNGPLKPAAGQTIVFEFLPNDIGTADFSEVTGTLTEEGMTITGPLGEQSLRRIEMRSETPDN